jgi:hypothetical protein
MTLNLTTIQSTWCTTHSYRNEEGKERKGKEKKRKEKKRKNDTDYLGEKKREKKKKKREKYKITCEETHT